MGTRVHKTICLHRKIPLMKRDTPPFFTFRPRVGNSVLINEAVDTYILPVLSIKGPHLCYTLSGFHDNTLTGPVPTWHDRQQLWYGFFLCIYLFFLYLCIKYYTNMVSLNFQPANPSLAYSNWLFMDKFYRVNSFSIFSFSFLSFPLPLTKQEVVKARGDTWRLLMCFIFSLFFIHTQDATALTLHISKSLIIPLNVFLTFRSIHHPQLTLRTSIRYLPGFLSSTFRLYEGLAWMEYVFLVWDASFTQYFRLMSVGLHLPLFTGWSQRVFI